VVCGLTVVTAMPTEPAGRAPAFLADYVTRDIGLGPGDLVAVERGEPVARSLETEDSHEVAIFAVVKVGIPKETYLERLRDIARLKQGDPVLQIGKFGQPARIDDLDGLTLDQVDINALKQCRVGDCHFALTTDAIGRLTHELDPAAPDFAAQAERWVRRFLLDRVHTYLARGDTALPVYTSRPEPVDVAGQFNAVLDASPDFFGFSPAMKRHLREYPNGVPGGVESFVYWSKEKVGPKPVISLTHVVVFYDPQQDGVVSVASKQLYASHYFEASLGLTVAIDDVSEAGGTGMYLIYVNRSRSDALTGFMGPLKRAIVRSRSRSGAEDALRRLKRTLETDAAASARSGGAPR
jgi:hypothetical protein